MEVIHIPGGCTGLCQPLDVGINKSFKCHVRQRWEELMISGIKRSSTVESPLCAEVSAWVAEVLLEMHYLPMLKKSRKKTGYNWFDGEVVEESNGEDTNDDDSNDYDEMENLVNNVLGNDEDDYGAVADEDINSEDDGSGKVDINNEEEEFFPVFKEEEGATVTTTE